MQTTSTLQAGTAEVKAAIAAELARARRRTLALLAPISEDELMRQHSPLMSPLVWDFAHIGHFEELWLLRELTRSRPIDPAYDDLYDAFENPRSERSALPLPRPHEARRYLDAVRERVLAALEATDLGAGERLLRGGFVYGLVVQHEHQHNETMLATIQLTERPYPLDEDPAPEPAPVAAPEVHVDGGAFVMGTDDEPWAYDNERPAHEVELAPFWIDATPVTNEAYAGFVEDGGYDDSRHWSEAGWEWRREADVEHPRFWRPDGDGSWSRARLGHLEPPPPDEPVQHVSWYEADAYARWAGKRLPTEAEWEKAATWDPAGRKRRFPWGDGPPGPEHANLGGRRFGPAPSGAYPAGASPWGCLGLLGDVWEWTSSDFLPYPGFAAFPYAEYSEVFFGCEYKVLRGGSWATDATVARATFRNWDYPVRRQIFAGFRCARDA